MMTYTYTLICEQFGKVKNDAVCINENRSVWVLSGVDKICNIDNKLIILIKCSFYRNYQNLVSI